MTRRCLPGGALALALMLGGAALSGCTSLVDAAALEAGCPEGQKECDGECVSVNSPEFGCAEETCAPCALSHATAGCSRSGTCAVSACIGAWEDCDSDVTNGCETYLDTDLANCGACGVRCEAPERAQPACGAADCYVRYCVEGFGDCDRVFENGCEVDLSTSDEHCGSCGEACAGECEGGRCVDARL